jgi:hypothetical protein
MLDLKVTNQDLIVNNGGNKSPDAGHRSHYPIFRDDNGDEYIYPDGQQPVQIGQTGLKGTRETVTR